MSKKDFWHGFFDGFLSPFGFFLAAPRGKEARDILAASEGAAERGDIDAFAGRQYRLFAASILRDSAVPPYPADNFGRAQLKLRQAFFRSARQEAKKIAARG